LDRHELLILQKKAERESVKQYLDAIIQDLNTKLQAAKQPTTSDRQNRCEGGNGVEPSERRDGPAVKEENKPWKPLTTYCADLDRASDFVTVDLRVKGVEALPKGNIISSFTPESFDLKVSDLDGENYRMVMRNLYSDIVPEKSRHRVKKNHVLVDLYREDRTKSWLELCAKDARSRQTNKKKDNPQEALTDLMKQMYDDGDDATKKLIGETMEKSMRGKTPMP